MERKRGNRGENRMDSGERQILLAVGRHLGRLPDDGRLQRCAVPLGRGAPGYEDCTAYAVPMDGAGRMLLFLKGGRLVGGHPEPGHGGPCGRMPDGLLETLFPEGEGSG